MTRIPRPIGTTILAQSLHSNANNKLDLNPLKHHLLNIYFLNNQTLNNQAYTIEQIAQLLQLSTIQVLRFMNKKLGYLSGFQLQGQETDIQAIQESLRETFFRFFLGALNHSQKADLQYDTLARAQGGKYKPYISEQVNKALSNLFASDHNMRETFKVMYTVLGAKQADSPNPFLVPSRSQSETISDSDPNRSLSLSDAMDLIEKQGSNRLLESAALRQNLLISHSLSDMPEVRANYQTETIKSAAPEDSSSVPITPTEGVSDPKSRHRSRREKIEGYEDIDQ